MNQGGAKREFPANAELLYSLIEQFSYSRPDTEIQALMEAPPNTEPIEDRNALQYIREAVAECMEKLTEEQIVALNGIFSEQITYEELKTRLGVKSKSHAHTIVKNALADLKEIMMCHPTLIDIIPRDEYEDWE